MEKAMNVSEMEEVKKAESHLISAAAFVDGGIQEACDDTCSICLEEFSESDPSTVTGCKHEFHLQCILEWCQRSSQCPMCWQAISLKDSTSQELLEAVERERKIRLAPSRHTTMFYHPTLGEFDLQHFPIGTNNPELEERIIQHLAAAAARGRTHHFSRREGQRSRSSAHGRPQCLVFSTHPDTPSTGATVTSEQTQHLPSAHADHTSSPASASTVIRTNHQTSSFNDRQSSSPSQDTAGPSDFQSISDSLKSRFNSMSMRYRDSISKSTKGWKERLFSRSSSMAGREVQREGITGLSSATNGASVVHRLNHLSVSVQSIQNEGEDGGVNTLADNKRPSSCGASSASS